MATKKITLNELKGLVKQLIKEENNFDYNNKIADAGWIARDMKNLHDKYTKQKKSIFYEY
jgi:hypothetical protein